VNASRRALLVRPADESSTGRLWHTLAHFQLLPLRTQRTAHSVVSTPDGKVDAPATFAMPAGLT